MIDIADMGIAALGAFALGTGFSAIGWRHNARNWRNTAEHWRRRAVHAEDAFAASEADSDFYRHQANSYRNRLFAAGKLTKAEASDHAREIGRNGRAKQLAKVPA